MLFYCPFDYCLFDHEHNTDDPSSRVFIRGPVMCPQCRRITEDGIIHPCGHFFCTQCISTHLEEIANPAQLPLDGRVFLYSNESSDSDESYVQIVDVISIHSDSSDKKCHLRCNRIAVMSIVNKYNLYINS